MKIRKKSDLRIALAFLLPHLIGFSLFQFFPIFGVVIFGFFDWNLISDPRFVGLSNFRRILVSDTFFWWSLGNTLFYIVGVVTLILISSLTAALLLNQKVMHRGFFRTMYFVPNVSSIVAVSLVWMWIYNADYGLLNALLRSIGIQNPPQWLSSTAFAMPAVTVMSAWTQFGFFTVIFLAGLQNIPGEYYESARIDGASPFQSFRHITFPLLSSTTFFALVLVIVNSFQVFEQTYVMTRGGPAFSTTTTVMYIYTRAFERFQIGYASAISLILFVFILLVTLVQVKLQKHWVHYEV